LSKSIGVIGGGQLARMMIEPARRLGLEIRVLAEMQNSPASSAATLVGDYKDVELVREFAKTVDVVTFDHEHVPLQVLETLEAEGFTFEPSSAALRFAQNKLEMRARLTELGIPCPAWAEINSAIELDQFISDHGGVAILKTPTGGYDGKGVRVVRSSSDAKDWLNSNLPLLAEEKVSFVRELAQLSAKNRSGQWASWPLVETIQKNGVCAEVLSPAQDADFTLAADIARTIAEGLDVTGVLAVELFETQDGKLLVNELAMRPHNSGHFSIEGSKTSQFEQHVRAAMNMPLGKTEPSEAFAVMLNLLGQNDIDSFQIEEDLELAGAFVHTYGKSSRVGRKMGHITAISANSIADAREIATSALNELQA
jgi:5-(carboxyamino)imidazole ribonucleotide synthase